MKVICAGFSKTGTKSLSAALTELGYEVYDSLEHFWYHEKEWEKIYNGEGSIDDFKHMYQNVDAAVDAPIYFFWEEISRAFPNAKIILTIRDEDSWFKSLQSQIAEMNRVRSGFLMILSGELVPTFRRFYRHLYQIGNEGRKWSWQPYRLNEMISRQTYRQHNAYVQMKAPKDQLLVYNIKDGWEPLCSFLGKEIPDKKFPHKNIAAKDTDSLFRNHPVGKQIYKEFVMISICCTVALGVGIYFFPKDPLYSGINKLLSVFKFVKSS